MSAALSQKLDIAASGHCRAGTEPSEVACDDYRMARPPVQEGPIVRWHSRDAGGVRLACADFGGGGPTLHTESVARG
jgi:hypothetical protein